jgi:hypothetical protein
MVIMLKNVKFLKGMTFVMAIALFSAISFVSCKEKAVEEEAVEAVEEVEEAVEEVVDTAAAAVEEAAPAEEVAK